MYTNEGLRFSLGNSRVYCLPEMLTDKSIGLKNSDNILRFSDWLFNYDISK